MIGHAASWRNRADHHAVFGFGIAPIAARFLIGSARGANMTNTTNQPAGPAPAGDATGGIIPYKNPPALIAYYLAVFSLIPVLGLPLGVAAVILGLKGLQKNREHPEVKGTAHAWIGIILGGLCALINLGVGVLIVVSLAVRR